MSSIPNKELSLKSIIDGFRVQKNANDKSDLYINLENAKKEWEEAKNIFENVSEPDLVDYAIYNGEAAEKKYVYLLRQIKKENVNVNWFLGEACFPFIYHTSHVTEHISYKYVAVTIFYASWKFLQLQMTIYHDKLNKRYKKVW